MARVGRIFRCHCASKAAERYESMQYLKIRFIGQAKAAISGLGFSSQSYNQAWDVLCKKFGRPRVIVEPQLKKIYTHPPVRHDDSSCIV